MDAQKESDLGSAPLAEERGAGDVLSTSHTSPLPDHSTSDPPPPPDTTSSLPHDGAAVSGRRTPTTTSGDDSDHTPRSEIPSVAQSPAPWNIVSTSSQPQTAVSEVEYFSSQPIRPHTNLLGPILNEHLQPHNTATTATGSTYTPSLRPEFEIVTGQGSHARLSPPPRPPKPLDRPQLQRDASNLSTASTATVRASHAHIDFAGPYPPRDYPNYPNQSYSALASQQYPSGLPKGRLWAQNRSVQTSQSSSQILTLGRLGHYIDQDVVSRTAGNTPASSPDLFTATSPSALHHLDERGHYSSPYLHPTQRKVPRETHVADVTKDVISGNKIINDYEVLDELGRGVHGKVKLGRNLITGDHIAIKMIPRAAKRKRLGKNDSHEEKIRREVAILKKVRHPNVVSLLEVIDDPKAKKVYLILELVELGEVNWRTRGAREITLVEYRRFQREKAGNFNDDAADFEDQRIISRAARRRERLEQRKWDEAQRQRLQAPPTALPDFWSAEYGGDSDDERETMTSRRSANARNRRRKQFENDEEKTLEASFQPTRGSSTSLSGLQVGSTCDSLVGTMYGPYEQPEISRGRIPSIASSSTTTSDNLDRDNDDDNDDDDAALTLGDNFIYVPTMTLSQTRSAIRDTVLGLEYLHYQGVVHRDIKPANLLCTSDHRVKISDFGVSYLGRIPKDENDGYHSESDYQDDEDMDLDNPVELAKTVGSPAYFAPELCDLDPDPTAEAPQVTQAIDIWALGVTLYGLVYGRLPFYTEGSEFHLMRVIHDVPAYIPRRRLKAVDGRMNSRPNSHGRNFQSMGSYKRFPHELEYEDVDDDLHDLLTRLLEKDPRKRITLREVKRHPWVVRDIEDKVAWLDETEPERQHKGKRIELTDHDLTQAVIPISAFERFGSVVKKTLAPVSNALGGILRSGSSRRRAKSSATSASEGGPPSTASSSSTISQDARRYAVRDDRRPSLKVDEFSAALKQSRDPEHPLSHSVVASPEQAYQAHYFTGTSSSRPSSPQLHGGRDVGDRSLPSFPKRPSPPDRALSAMSTATSIKTVKQADFIGAGAGPATASQQQSSADHARHGSKLSSFHKIGRQLREMSSRERFRHHRTSELPRDRSFDRFMGGEEDNHAVASVAYSAAVAAGHVEQPSALRGNSPMHSAYGSPVATSSPNTDRLHPDLSRNTPSRQSSVSSISSRPYDLAVLERPLTRGSVSNQSHPCDSSDQDILRAKGEQVRRLLQEEAQNKRQSHQPSQKTSSSCPPSPDDEIFQRNIKAGNFDQVPQLSSSVETSPASQATDPRPLISSSSEDRFGLGMSPETSSPSLPSMLSASSSVADNHSALVNVSISKPSDASLVSSNDAGYTAGEDRAIDSQSDDDDFDSDEEDLVMMSRKPRPKSGLSAGDFSSTELARRRKNQSLGQISHKSTRSGSGGTLKKVRSHSVPEEDALGRSRGISPHS